MKIVAQSEVASQPTYMHLAYVAATTGANYFTGMMTFIVTLLVLQYQISHKIAPRWRRVTLAVGGAVLFFLLLFPMSESYQHPASVTMMRARSLHSVVRRLQAEGKVIPSSTRVLASNLPELDERPDQSAHDTWGREFRIEKHKRDGETDYRFTSAGADGRFGTNDDITYPQEAAGQTR